MRRKFDKANRYQMKPVFGTISMTWELRCKDPAFYPTLIQFNPRPKIVVQPNDEQIS